MPAARLGCGTTRCPAAAWPPTLIEEMSMCAPGSACGCGSTASDLGGGVVMLVVGAVAVGGVVAFLAAHLVLLALAAVALPVATLATVRYLRRYMVLVHKQPPLRVRQAAVATPALARPRTALAGSRAALAGSRPALASPGLAPPSSSRARPWPSRPPPSSPWAAITCTSTGCPRRRSPRSCATTVSPRRSAARTWPSRQPRSAPGPEPGWPVRSARAASSGPPAGWSLYLPRLRVPGIHVPVLFVG